MAVGGQAGQVTRDFDFNRKFLTQSKFSGMIKKTHSWHCNISECIFTFVKLPSGSTNRPIITSFYPISAKCSFRIPNGIFVVRPSTFGDLTLHTYGKNHRFNS